MKQNYADAQQYIRARSVPDPNSGCWLWLNYAGPSGYGRCRPWEGEVLAHRVAYIAFRGEIPPGLFVLHRCDVRCCVNPNHLFVGTNDDNVRDRVLKGRNPRLFGTDNPFSKLNWEAVRSIRSGQKTAAALAAEFGVDQTTIRNARSGRSWKGAVCK